MKEKVIEDNIHDTLIDYGVDSREDLKELAKELTQTVVKLFDIPIYSNWVSSETPPKKGRYLVKTDTRIEIAEYDPVCHEWIGNAALGVMDNVEQWAEIPCC